MHTTNISKGGITRRGLFFDTPIRRKKVEPPHGDPSMKICTLLQLLLFLAYNLLFKIVLLGLDAFHQGKSLSLKEATKSEIKILSFIQQLESKVTVVL